MTTSVLTLDNITIKTDSEGRFCLNDLHKAAGGEPKHRPNYFMDRVETDDLRYELKKDWMERAGIPAVLTVTGRNGGTYVAKELVYAYAMWISPAFHLKVIRAYDRLATQGVAVHENAAADAESLSPQNCLRSPDIVRPRDTPRTPREFNNGLAWGS